jgi:hypothetical protein
MRSFAYVSLAGVAEFATRSFFFTAAPEWASCKIAHLTGLLWAIA